MTGKQDPGLGTAEAGASSRQTESMHADAIVVGAGPAGSTAATYLARAGLSVLLLEKCVFPREKVCGDGVTPRGVKQLVDLGIDVREEGGWVHNRGVRIVVGESKAEVEWPDTGSFPSYGLVRRRQDFDAMLARNAETSGAVLVQGTTVVGPVFDERSIRIVGVRANRGEHRLAVEYRAPLVLACDGGSSRLAVSAGIGRRHDRPIGVAIRRYFASSRSKDDLLEVHLDLWDRSQPGEPKPLPGYGWIFGMGDGMVNVGIGALTPSKTKNEINYRALLRSWLDTTPEEWGLREANAMGKVMGAALPMAFNRVPHYQDGLLLVGDAGGIVNPFSGEGIAYAIESARIAAECAAQALQRPTESSRELALARYPGVLSEYFGGYFRMGMIFTKLIGNPTVMKVAAKQGLNKPQSMRFILKLLVNIYDPRDGDVTDRVIDTIARLSPSV